jgi:hypothetical protein
MQTPHRPCSENRPGSAPSWRSVRFSRQPPFSSPVAGSLQTSAAITKPDDLICFEWDDLCRWRNIEGLFIDELDWYRGSGFLDSVRLQASTGTQISPSILTDLCPVLLLETLRSAIRHSCHQHCLTSKCASRLG